MASGNCWLPAARAAKRLLAEEGYSEEYGARPLRRVIQNQVEDALSDAILTGRFHVGDTVLTDAEEGEIVLRQAARAEEEEEEPVVELAAP